MGTIDRDSRMNHYVVVHPYSLARIWKVIDSYREHFQRLTILRWDLFRIPERRKYRCWFANRFAKINIDHIRCIPSRRSYQAFDCVIFSCLTFFLINFLMRRSLVKCHQTEEFVRIWTQHKMEREAIRRWRLKRRRKQQQLSQASFPWPPSAIHRRGRSTMEKDECQDVWSRIWAILFVLPLKYSHSSIYIPCWRASERRTRPLKEEEEGNDNNIPSIW